jgi:signal transduction histidine kinase
VFHEVERGVRALYTAIKGGAKLELLEEQSRNLTRVLDGFATLLRRDERSNHRGSLLVTQARKFNSLRFGFHRIGFESDDGTGEGGDFEASLSFGLVLGALNNLIDNSIYWLKVRWPNLPAKDEPAQRRLYVGVSNDLDEGPAIIVADNGPGFSDSPDRVVTPFFTRKPGGMGLGLYYANMVMELNGGAMRFLHSGDVGLPDRYDGAIVALVFKGGKKVAAEPKNSRNRR